jgi:maltose O-acetyltransferase
VTARRYGHLLERRLRLAPHQVTAWFRIRWFRALSTNDGAYAGSRVVTPVLGLGTGRIDVRGVQFGFLPSPHAYDGCIHVEARSDSVIRIGGGGVVNNGCTLVAEGPGITIGADALIGPEVMIFDSDFHSLEPSARRSRAPSMGEVVIGDNVFIGARALILKGVRIGDGTVVGAGSVVVSDLPAGSICAGNPCRPITNLS